MSKLLQYILINSIPKSTIYIHYYIYINCNFLLVNIEKSSTKCQRSEFRGKDYLDVKIIRK